jgi:hypothetical protein
MWMWVDKLIGVDGYVKEYIDKQQESFPKNYYNANHVKSMHKYMNTKFKVLNWKANINFRFISFYKISHWKYGDKYIRLHLCIKRYKLQIIL